MQAAGAGDRLAQAQVEYALLRLWTQRLDLVSPTLPKLPRMTPQCLHTCNCLGRPLQDVMEALQDMREYDVPYHVRFAIDCDIRCGHWFTVRCRVSAVRGVESGWLEKPCPERTPFLNHLGAFSA